MASEKQRAAARKNVKKAQAGAREKKTIAGLSSRTRSALGREGAKAAARKRGTGGVRGHEILPIGGHQNSPRAAANSPHWRPRISPLVLS